MYVCMYVYVYVCMYVLSLQPTPFELASWNLNHEVYIWLSQNAFFTFWKFWFVSELSPFFQFSQLSLYQGFEHADYDNQWLKLKLCITRKHCVYSNFIDWTVTSSNDVISCKIWTHVWYHISIVHNQRFTCIYIYIATKKSNHMIL